MIYSKSAIPPWKKNNSVVKLYQLKTILRLEKLQYNEINNINLTNEWMNQAPNVFTNDDSASCFCPNHNTHKLMLIVHPKTKSPNISIANSFRKLYNRQFSIFTIIRLQ